MSLMTSRWASAHFVLALLLCHAPVGGQESAVARSDDPVPSFSELKSSVLDARKNLQAGHVQFQVSGADRLPTPEGGQSAMKPYQTRLDVWFDKGKLRGDLHAASGETLVNCFGCLPVPGSHVTYTNRQVEKGQMSLTVAAVGEISVGELVVDPRWIGLFPSGLRTTTMLTPDAIFSERSGTESHVERVRLDDRHCYHMSWENMHSVKYSCWVDPVSFAVLRAEGRYQANGQDYRETLDVDLEAHGDIAYPKRLVYEQHVGEELNSREEVLVESATFDAPPDKIFTLPGIEILKPGTPVHWAMTSDRPSRYGNLVWNGSKIVTEDFVGTNATGKTTLQPASLGRRVVLGLVVFALVLGVGWACLRRFATAS